MRYPHFHLSIGVNSTLESTDFFERVLLAVVTHRDPSGYVNVDFCGCQITLQKGGAPRELGPLFHFGVNMEVGHFEHLARHVAETEPGYIVKNPETWDEGTPLERRKMYVRCPWGYLIELKGYRDNFSAGT